MDCHGSGAFGSFLIFNLIQDLAKSNVSWRSEEYWARIKNAMETHSYNLRIPNIQRFMCLLESMDEYGYNSSLAQRRAVTHLLFGDNVLLHTPSNFLAGHDRTITGSCCGDRLNVHMRSVGHLRVVEGVCYSGSMIMQKGEMHGSNSDVPNTYVLGRMVACCVGVLCNLEEDEKCLILTVNREINHEFDGDRSEFTRDMIAIAAKRPVVVGQSIASGKLDNQVTIVDMEDMYCIIVDEMEFDYSGINMVVFEWRFQTNSCYFNVAKVIKNICKHLNKNLERRVQIAIFSENLIPEPAREEILSVLDENSKLSVGEPLVSTVCLSETSYWRDTLKGIVNHMLVWISENEEDDVKLGEVMSIIHDTRLCEENRIIIFANGAADLRNLICKLEENGIDYVVAREGMSQRDREQLVDDFFSVKLLITNDKWHRDMPLCYFDAHIHSIIHYDCIESINYVKRVGWFGNVKNVIAVAYQRRIHTLLNIQESYGIVFGRMGVDKVGGKEFEKQKHYVLHGIEDKEFVRKVGSFMEVVDLTSLKNGHVIFFVRHDSVDKFVSALKEAYQNVQNLFITSHISELKMWRPCILVTSDDDAIKEEQSHFSELREKTLAVISFEKPQKLEYYRVRFAWSKNVVVVVHYLETFEEYFELFDLQMQLGVRLERYPDNTVWSFLKQTY